jgi:hypothetical protein
MPKTSPPIVALQIGCPPGPGGAPAWRPDDALLARSLFTTWAVRTGRILRAVPVTELTPGELIEFWADDQLEPPGTRGRGAVPLPEPVIPRGSA